MNRHQRAKLLPELMRFAGDASLDHITRTWIFDALRDVTGQSLPDEPSPVPPLKIPVYAGSALAAGVQPTPALTLDPAADPVLAGVFVG